MLIQLKLKNVALIEIIEINFEKGLNVLTGDSGSGKSLILDSLNVLFIGNSYTASNNIVTQNKENTKAVSVNRVLLDQVISEGSDNFLLKLPLINESFLNVNMKRISVLSPNHNLIIETTNGKEIKEYTNY